MRMPIGHAPGATGSCWKRGSAFHWPDLGTGPKAQGLSLLTTASPGSILADGANPGSGRPSGVSLMEDPPQRLRWQAHLEFTHNHDVGDLTWDKIAVSLPRSEKLRSLVLAGIPHSMRPQVRRRGTCRGPAGVQVSYRTLMEAPPQLWMRLSGALQKKRNSELSYREMVKNSSNDETIAAKQVRLGRHQGPFRKCFQVRNYVWACRRAVSRLGLRGPTLLVCPWQGWPRRAGSCVAALPLTDMCLEQACTSWVPVGRRDHC